ncbi:MAG: uracil-DNA glycosylase family protein [Candidatus Dojkabacteria bacterium]|nr:uracil-DNA glycosylase family protein [Candidatus Dojkabacteria bacterium]
MITMSLEELNNQYKQMQNEYGDSNLDSILYGGQLKNPKLCLIFMNPTGRNIAAEKSWIDLKSPWIGTKNVWKLFNQSGLISNGIAKEISNRKGSDWDYEFTQRVYKEIEDNNVYITNLAKCTQTDARPLPDRVFKDYLHLLHEELDIVRPEKIITFGNQVSKIFIGKPISVSKDRKNIYNVNIKNTSYQTLPVYYPVGQGQRNMSKAVEDIKWYLNS